MKRKPDIFLTPEEIIKQFTRLRPCYKCRNIHNEAGYCVSCFWKSDIHNRFSPIDKPIHKDTK